MAGDPHDPRSEAEKARADLKRNAELGYAVNQTPLTRQPSVTPETFGVTNDKARILSGTDQGVEAGGVVDSEQAGTGNSEAIVEAEQSMTGRDHSAPAARPSDEADALSRARE